MALIKCPECNKDISDKAKVCIHCGYPLETTPKDQENTYVPMNINIFGQVYDINKIYTEHKDDIKHMFDTNGKIKCIGFIRLKYNLGLKEAKCIVDNMYDRIYLPSVANNESNTTITSPPPSALPKCPTCGSINIEKVSSSERGLSFLWAGLVSKKLGKQFKCKDCGYYW